MPETNIYSHPVQVISFVLLIRHFFFWYFLDPAWCNAYDKFHGIEFSSKSFTSVMFLTANKSFHYVSELKEIEILDASATKSEEGGSFPSLTLAKKKFSGRYAITSDEFTGEMVRIEHIVSTNKG